ncbi:MAG: hypothetical protein ACRDS0_06080 [Pseudonocardiaceae bacterium]
MTTLDFELEIGPGVAGSYPVVARVPGGEAATTLRWSVTPAELDHQLAVIKDKVLMSAAVVRRAPTEDEQPVRALGQRLFEAVIGDDVRALNVASRQRARDQSSALRLVLRVRPPELARLPWEFLFDPSQGDYLGLTMPLVRYPQVLAPRQPLQVAPPLRILGMVARPGEQHPSRRRRRHQPATRRAPTTAAGGAQRLRHRARQRRGRVLQHRRGADPPGDPGRGGHATGGSSLAGVSTRPMTNERECSGSDGGVTPP